MREAPPTGGCGGSFLRLWSVRLSLLRMSVRHTLVLCQNDSSYNHAVSGSAVSSQVGFCFETKPRKRNTSV